LPLTIQTEALPGRSLSATFRFRRLASENQSSASLHFGAGRHLRGRIASVCLSQEQKRGLAKLVRIALSELRHFDKLVVLIKRQSSLHIYARRGCTTITSGYNFRKGQVYIMERAYYDTRGRIIARPGTFMFNAPGAIHGGISCDLTLYIHCCSGEPDEIVSVGLIDFRPDERL
jgi:hypothetical protein